GRLGHLRYAPRHEHVKAVAGVKHAQGRDRLVRPAHARQGANEHEDRNTHWLQHELTSKSAAKKTKCGRTSKAHPATSRHREVLLVSILLVACFAAAVGFTLLDADSGMLLRKYFNYSSRFVHTTPVTKLAVNWIGSKKGDWSRDGSGPLFRKT